MITYSDTIVIKPGVGLECIECEGFLCEENEKWKEKVKLNERSLSKVAGESYSGTNKKLMLHQFYCPECGHLLDSEIALKGEPFLNDCIFT